VAIGTRLAPGARVVRGFKREAISRGYNLLLRGTLAVRFSDAQCGFKAIRRDVAQRLLPLVQDSGWFFDTELLVLAQRTGLRIHEVPVDWVDDPDSRVDIVATALADLRGVARVSRALATGALPIAALRAQFGRGITIHSVRAAGVDRPPRRDRRGSPPSGGQRRVPGSSPSAGSTPAGNLWPAGDRDRQHGREPASSASPAAAAAPAPGSGAGRPALGLGLTSGSFALHALTATPPRAADLTCWSWPTWPRRARFVLLRLWMYHRPATLLTATRAAIPLVRLREPAPIAPADHGRGRQAGHCGNAGGAPPRVEHAPAVRANREWVQGAD
jgi:hypothetical protein